MMKRPVLVVEDEAIIALDLADILKAAGYRVVGPEKSVSAALLRAKFSKLHAAILDIKLGLELVYPVADVLAATRIPFVFSTSQTVDQLPERHRGKPLVRKPYEPGHLLEALSNATAA